MAIMIWGNWGAALEHSSVGAFIGIAIQLALIAVGLAITLLVWTVRLMLGLLAVIASTGRLVLGTRRR